MGVKLLSRLYMAYRNVNFVNSSSIKLCKVIAYKQSHPLIEKVNGSLS